MIVNKTLYFVNVLPLPIIVYETAFPFPRTQPYPSIHGLDLEDHHQRLPSRTTHETWFEEQTLSRQRQGDSLHRTALAEGNYSIFPLAVARSHWGLDPAASRACTHLRSAVCRSYPVVSLNRGLPSSNGIAPPMLHGLPFVQPIQIMSLDPPIPNQQSERNRGTSQCSVCRLSPPIPIYRSNQAHVLPSISFHRLVETY